MRTVNSVTLLGNIVREPDMRMTAGGKEFATFVMATHRDSLKEGERTTVPDFHNLVAWGSLAQIVRRFCSKGRLVYIEGYLKTRSWESESGERISRTEVIATNLIALSSDEEQRSKEALPPLDRSDTFFNASEDDFFKEEK